jgi:hypothetical protein
MSKKEPDVEVPEEEIAATQFIDIFASLIYDGEVIIDGIDDPRSSDMVTSATTVHRFILGILTSDGKYINLFPEVLIKRLRKRYIKYHWPRVFCKKKYLREMLSRQGLITRDADNCVVKHVRYNGVLVKTWQLDWTEFNNRCCNDAIKAN